MSPNFNDITKIVVVSLYTTVVEISLTKNLERKKKEEKNK